MLIIKLTDEIKDTKSFLLRFMMGKNHNILRETAVIGNRQFDIVTMTYNDLISTEWERIFCMNKGNILESLNNEQNDFLYEYLFDKKPYLKRALLSSVTNFVKKSGDLLSVSVCDECFLWTEEYDELASCVKSFVLVTDKSSVVDSFAEKIYYKYGLRVVIRQNDVLSECDLFVDFSRIGKDGSLFANFKGEGVSFYPEKLYFEPNDDVLRLVGYGVPIKCACAVLGDCNYMA